MSQPAAPRLHRQPPRPPRRKRKPMPLPSRAAASAPPSPPKRACRATKAPVPFDARTTVMCAPRATAAATQPIVVESRSAVTVVSLPKPAAPPQAAQRPAVAPKPAVASSRAVVKASSSRDLRPGDVVAQRYRVNAIISRSRGLLLDATRTAFDQRVAIRVLTRSMVDGGAVKQFHREAGILARLESEHVARITDFGALPDGALYLAREYVRGQSLASLAAERGGLPLQEAILYVLQVAEAVQEAHTHGVVLRDLQPNHVFLADKRNGAPVAKLTDFGTCKVVRDPSAAGELSCTRLLGLSPSASPELVGQSKHIGIGADVWSLGCMLYELVTGRPAFEGDGVQLVLNIAREPHTPASQLRADLPVHFDKMMAWALAKDPKQRFSDVYAFAHELRTFACRRGCLLIEEIGRLATGCAVAPISNTVTTAVKAAKQVAVPPAARPQDDDRTLVRKVRPEQRDAWAKRAVAKQQQTSTIVTVPVAAAQPVLAQPARQQHISSAAESGPQAWMFDADSQPPKRRRLAWLAALPAAAAVVLGLSFASSAPAATASGGGLSSAAQGFDIAAYSSAPAADAAVSGEDAANQENVADSTSSDSTSSDSTSSDSDAADKKAKKAKTRTSKSPRRAYRGAPRGGQFLGLASRQKSRRKALSSSKKKAGRGTLVAMAVGSSCSFTVDGAGRGSGSSIRISVPAGSHTVSCTQAGGTSRRRTVRVAAGKAAVAVFKF